MTRRAHTTSPGWEATADQSCGGVAVNGVGPKWCEVHMLPWGHDRQPQSDTPRPEDPR